MTEPEDAAQTKEAGAKSFVTRRRLLTAGLGGAVAITGGGYYLVSNRLVVEKVDLPLQGLTQSFKAVLIADLHLPNCPAPLPELAQLINGLSPDVVFAAGDAYNLPEDNLKRFADFLKSLQAPLGVFAIPGNWEHQTGPTPAMLKRAVNGPNTRFLWNENVTVKAGSCPVTIAGIDDAIGGRPDYNPLGGVPQERPLVVLAHCPAAFDNVLDAVKRPFVQLSGHTHGGQIAPLGVVLYTPPGSGPYVAGTYKKDDSTLYVTRGIGCTGLNLRLGARPEVTLITFSPKKNYRINA